MHVYIHIYVCIYVYLYTYIYTYLYVYKDLYVGMICVCIYSYMWYNQEVSRLNLYFLTSECRYVHS